MNKSESKYFNTAARMDEAFLALLEKKDFEYITVKEICEKAGVNRSTFYLHYETVGDLLEESVEHMIKKFLEYMKMDSASVISKIKECSLSELYFVTSEQLIPYLNYVSENRRLFLTSIRHAGVLGLDAAYSSMMKYVFSPILERFGIGQGDAGYMMAYYVNGLIAVITRWLENDCAESAEYIIGIMQRCAAFPGR